MRVEIVDCSIALELKGVGRFSWMEIKVICFAQIAYLDLQMHFWRSQTQLQGRQDESPASGG